MFLIESIIKAHLVMFILDLQVCDMVCFLGEYGIWSALLDLSSVISH